MIDGHTVTPTGYVKIDILLPDHIFHTNATILNSTVGRESERIEKWLRFVMKWFFFLGPFHILKQGQVQRSKRVQEKQNALACFFRDS